MTYSTRLLLVLTLLGGCRPVTLPVPVEGSIDQLVGEWSGEFSSAQTGRFGSIFFRLEAGRDTATGDVVLIPDRTYNVPTAPEWNEHPWSTSAHVLEISFVRCTDGEVDGWIKPYRNPDTGELTHTEFTGVIVGDSLKGTFVTRGQNASKGTSGTWAVVRTRRK